MKYRTSSAFDRDFAGLPAEHRRMFLAALREHFLPAIAEGRSAARPHGLADRGSTVSPAVRSTH